MEARQLIAKPYPKPRVQLHFLFKLWIVMHIIIQVGGVQIMLKVTRANTFRGVVRRRLILVGGFHRAQSAAGQTTRLQLSG